MGDISEHYGGSIVAMVGGDSLIVVGDRRLGMASFTVGTERSSLFVLSRKVVLGLTGFVPDCQSLHERIKKQVKMFELNEGREIEVDEVVGLVSYILYSHRKTGPLYLSPIVAGLDSENKPRAYSLDCLGYISEYQFVTAGTACDNLTGICEALFVEGMEVEQLFTTAMQSFLNAVDRDALSGWGAECYIVGKEGLIRREVKGRND
ncbi:PSB3 [Enterospora canceri]|uniref:PSB3 n=1 Tax=Enterospora canceri TaxID=1081671 RepID=A0A1Y1S8T3_9MICR|nr:PSB3 [Enterospora canceri]